MADDHGRQAISHDGTVWLPVETTALAQGFSVAWRKAGELLVRHKGQTEFFCQFADGTLLSAGKDVLRGISASIPAGSFTALVGRSGAGKSTLVELLPRLHEATGGTITYDGVDIRQFQVGSLRKGIGYLTQSAMLFNDTVRENLIYGLDFEPTEAQAAESVLEVPMRSIPSPSTRLQVVMTGRAPRRSVRYPVRGVTAR